MSDYWCEVCDAGAEGCEHPNVSEKIVSVQESDRRQSMRALLLSFGLQPGSSIHGWRCEHPEVYGPCSCLEELLDELVKVG